MFAYRSLSIVFTCIVWIPKTIQYRPILRICRSSVVHLRLQLRSGGTSVDAHMLLHTHITLRTVMGISRRYRNDYLTLRITSLIHTFIMRPSSLGGGRILRRTLSVRLSVCPSVRLSVRPVIVYIWMFTLEASYERTSKIEKLLFSLMGQRHVCSFRHAQRAAYRTAISAAQTCLTTKSQLASDILQ